MKSTMTCRAAVLHTDEFMKGYRSGNDFMSMLVAHRFSTFIGFAAVKHSVVGVSVVRESLPPCFAYSMLNPRLALATMLNAKPGDATVLLAMVCSSFCGANLGTSCRSIVCPLGDESKLSVKKANVMISRTSVTCVLCIFPQRLE